MVAGTGLNPRHGDCNTSSPKVKVLGENDCERSEMGNRDRTAARTRGGDVVVTEQNHGLVRDAGWGYIIWRAGA